MKYWPWHNQKKASAALEYMTLIAFVLAALFIMQNYILRGFSGRWKTMGDSFGQGRQYDPRAFGPQGQSNGTLDCFYDNDSNKWVDEKCFEQQCDCMLPESDSSYQVRCLDCKVSCHSAFCDN